MLDLRDIFILYKGPIELTESVDVRFIGGVS
jgi:hypothetical protein